MKIAVIVEGATEKEFLIILQEYLESHLAGRMPKLDPVTCHGPIPKGDGLRKLVQNLLSGKNACDHAIALTDVYTGAEPPDFLDANDARAKMRQWVGNEPRFHPHAAQYESEAWLLPFWRRIKELARTSKDQPAGNPELVNYNNPPSQHIREAFRTSGLGYVKARDVRRIIQHGSNLSTAIEKCSELKAFVNTILSICGAETIK